MNRCGSNVITLGTRSRRCSCHASNHEIPPRFDTFDHGMPVFGLELLQLKADDDVMEEDELQEEEEQLNMHMHVRRAAAEAAAAAADAPASLHQLLRLSPVRAPSMTAPSHCHAVLCRDAAVRCHLPLSDGLPVMRAGACAQSARSAIRSAIRQAWTDAHDQQVTVQPGILAQCELIS